MTHGRADLGRCLCPNPRRKGMTLIELVVSASILSILAGAVGSTILIATRAAQVSAGAASEWPDATEAIDQIRADLEVAIGFTERTDTAATFTVPDRNGDGAPETLRYAWSEIAGDPLLYQYNGGSPRTIARNVYDFNLSYLLRTVAGTCSPSGAQEQESEEMAQYFHPTLPTNTISWKITRVEFRAKTKAQPSGTLAVQIARADASQKPTTEVLDAVEVPESALSPSYDWYEVGFTVVSELAPSQGYCLVIKGITDSAGTVQWERNGSPMTPNTHWMTSDNGGGSWSDPVESQDMRFYVYGTVTTLGEPQWP